MSQRRGAGSSSAMSFGAGACTAASMTSRNSSNVFTSTAQFVQRARWSTMFPRSASSRGDSPAPAKAASVAASGHGPGGRFAAER
ncbi:MAG: hypothetical protein IPF53_08180 [Blastocatellia bacterium]|nr:hypothetical protein [Blastocatellia bacterium]